MEPATVVRSVKPLTRVTASGETLRRPARVEAEIAMALELSPAEARALAEADPGGEEVMSSECIVHLIRLDLRAGQGPHKEHSRLSESLLPVLLRRCETTLRGAIRGFQAADAQEIREDILGRLAVSLVEPGGAADFFEVRFALALKRLRIDACRRQRRRERGRVTMVETTSADDSMSDSAFDRRLDRHRPEPAGQENRLLIRQALNKLDASEREVLVLHKLAGMPLHSKSKQDADLVDLLGLSERTLRNRLRNAEAKLRAFAGGES